MPLPGRDLRARRVALDEAADLLDGSEVARNGLGNALVDALVASARAECSAAAAEVGEWERQRGFERR